MRAASGKVNHNGCSGFRTRGLGINLPAQSVCAMKKQIPAKVAQHGAALAESFRTKTMQHFRKVSFLRFTILAFAFSTLCFAAKAADVSLYAIYKRQVYVQNTEAEPAVACCANIFNGVIELTESNSVT